MTSTQNPLPRASTQVFVAFAGPTRIAAGGLAETAAAARRAQDENPIPAIVVFNRDTAEVVDLDLRGTPQDIALRYAEPGERPAPRGRPRLGVVAREVTLLPRHWDWLAGQPGGASITLRKLVERASKDDASVARARTGVAYRFMSVMAGDLPGFEDATRALFAGERDSLDARLSTWPADIADEIRRFLDGSAALG